MPGYAKDPLLLTIDHDDRRRLVIDGARALAVAGAPFVLYGRTAAGVDCVGLVKVSADAAGLTVVDSTLYDEDTQGDEFLEALRARLVEIDPDDARPGDWFAMTYRRATRHLALLSENDTLIQASQLRLRVTEHSFTEREQSRIVTAFRYAEFT